MHLFSSSEADFETELQTLLKGHQKKLMASIKQRLTGVTGDIVDRVLALCMEVDEIDDLDVGQVREIADGASSPPFGDRRGKDGGNVDGDGAGP